jgi:putative ABC transport system permease protein
VKLLPRFKRRRQREQELDEEIRSHLAMAIRERIEQGEDPAEAEANARREFGNLGLVKDVTRDMWGWRWLESFLQDLRYGLRQLRRNPGFTMVAVLTLALGIGASTAIFSVVYTVLVNPYPYKGAGRMVNFSIIGKGGSQSDSYSLEELRAIRDQNHVFDGVIGYSAHDWVLSGGKVPESVFVTEMAGNAFQYFGVPPLFGREWTRTDAPKEKTPAQVAILSFRFWKEHYASAGDVIGKSLRLNGRPYTIIGVLPRRFTWHNADVYLPTDRSWKYVWIGARLRPGVTLGQAKADVSLIFERMEKRHPHTFPPGGFTVKVERLDNWALGSFREKLILLVLAVGLLLLIACSNVANLQLAKASGREAEVAVRTSVGASRERVIRQLLTESMLLSLLGGALGTLLAFEGVRLIVLIMPPNAIPHETILGVNGQALLFAVVLSVAVGSLSGLAPALGLAKLNMAESLSHAGRGGAGSTGRNRIRRALIIIEYAVALVLLVSAGLTLRTFLALRAVGLGFDPSHILTMDIPIHWGATSWKERVTDLDGILSRIKSLPRVEASALSISTEPPPLPAFLHTSVYAQDASAEERHTVQMNLVSPGFFQTFRVPLIRGRIFTSAEVHQGRQVVVVSRSTAKLLWPANEDPVGRRIHLSLEGWEIKGIAWPPDLNGWCEVVGVVGDVRNQGLERPPKPAFYIPYTLLVPSEATLSLRAASNPLLLSKEVRFAIASEMNGQPVTNVWRLSDYLAAFSFSHDRFSVVLFLLFGLLGLALCASGIYSVVSYVVSRRTHEIGIRMALGARKGQVLWMVIREMMVLVLIGVGVGIAGASGVTWLFADQLFSVSPLDPLTLVVVSLILASVALFACYVPARRATKVDPLIALRYE